MGAVYLAEQLPLGRKVALKVLEIAAENLSGKAQFQERFLLEAAAVAKLSHPNTIVLYDYGRTDDGLFYYAMELIEGITLSKLISKSRAIEPALAVHIAAQIGGSLREAHELGLVHRDLKPGNVMLTRRGDDAHFAKVLDFGLVKVVGSDGASDLTRSGIVMGSPRYMAPEQVESRNVDHRADIYAFGTVLYHMLAGEPPFLYPSQFETLRAQVDEAPPPLEAKNPWCQAGPELRALVFQCLEKSPDLRPQSMAEIAQRLKACAMEIGISVPSISSVDVSLLGGRRATPIPERASNPPTMASTPSARAIRRPSVPAQAPSPAPEPAAAPPPKRSLAWLIPVAVILLAGAGAATTALLLPKDEPAVSLAPPIPVPAAAPAPAPAPAPPEAPPPVSLVSDPPGARVRHGDADLGDAPLSLPIPAGERWELTLSLDGYQPRTITVASGRPTVNVRLSPIPTPAEPRQVRARNRPSPRREPPPELQPQPRPLPEPPPADTWSPRPQSDNRDPWAQ